LLEDPHTALFISSLSITELAIKSNKGRSALSREDVEEIIDDLKATVLPFGANHALRLFGLPLHHGDPFDRMLIATALAEEMPIVARDDEFKKYKGLRVIW
jgi:PIN domain nuclease of toxin-antitoxin system